MHKHMYVYMLSLLSNTCGYQAVAAWSYQVCMSITITIWLYDYRSTANNQKTINPIKMGKCLLWDSDLSPSSPSRTDTFTCVTT